MCVLCVVVSCGEYREPLLILTGKYLPQSLLGCITLEGWCVRVTVFALSKYCWGMVFYVSFAFPCSCLVFHSRTSTPCLNMDVFTAFPPYSILIEDPKELTPSNRFFLEKLTVLQRVKKIPFISRNALFRTVFFLLQTPAFIPILS